MKFLKENYVFFLPSVPVFLYFGIEALVFLMHLAQSLLVALVLLYALGFIFGLVQGIITNPVATLIVKSRLAKLIVTISLGASCIAWLLEDIHDKPAK